MKDMSPIAGQGAGLRAKPVKGLFSFVEIGAGYRCDGDPPLVNDLDGEPQWVESRIWSCSKYTVSLARNLATKHRRPAWGV